MTLDLSGALLEGIRVSEGNNPFTFPPRTLVTNGSAFNSITGRAEYVLIAASSTMGKQSSEIADPDLRFVWTKNESSVQRFSYDSFSKRWLPSPGGAPDVLGALDNTDRIVAPIPDPSVADAPFALYVGSPVRSITFNVQIVGTVGDFSPPASVPAGTVQLSKADGKLNFSSTDVALFGGQAVLSQRQSFFDRTKVSGRIGALPESSLVEYFIFMNPRPAPGSFPEVRIDYANFLVPIEVADEASLGTPASGTFTWSRDTGRIRLSPADVDANAGLNVYYSGVILSAVVLTRTLLGSITASFPSPAFFLPAAIGNTDYQRFVFFAEKAGKPRNYFTVQVVSSAALPAAKPPAGTVYLAFEDGAVYFSPSDSSTFSSWTVSCVDTVASVEDGVSVQFYRSGVNTSGPAVEPDFTIFYFVEDQILVDGLGGSPFVMLPTVPVTDSVLKYTVQQGPSSSGTFTGNLVKGSDPGSLGTGYLLNLDAHQLSFSSRKKSQIVLPSATPSVKLADAAVSELGFEVARNGTPLVPGVDFDFDPGTGLLNFIDPVGEDDPSNRLGIPGATSGNSFVSTTLSFFPSDFGKFLLVHTGPSQGLYTIAAYVAGDEVLVSPAFPTVSSTTADVRSSAETVADRFWTDILPPLKKFSISSGSSPAGPFTQMALGTFNVFANTGQVNLSAPALPGQAFQVVYVALETPDNGATYIPVNKVELALFKIRQETATTTPGSADAQFNPDGKTVNTARPIVAYLNGVPLDQRAFEFAAPGTLRLADPLTDGQSLVLDYWVEDATGGETSFNLLSDKVDIDVPQISSGATSTVFNGDQRSIVASGSGLLVGGIDALTVQSVSYSPSSDTTTVLFDVPAVADSSGAVIQSCAPINGLYVVTEPLQSDIFVKGTNAISFTGLVQGYPTGTVIRVDGDPYYVLGSSYDQPTNKTKVTISATARRNYVAPTITRTVRPVFNPGRSFQTSRSADLTFPVTLVEMGNVNKVLVQGVDYQIANGGAITLTRQIGFGDVLYAMYVAAAFQPAGTLFDLNYAFAIAPSSLNGLLGQQLLSTYNLYAPDTFFYRVETVETFLPEVTALLKQSAQSGGSSGPNTANASSMSNKDFGRPSPWFNEQDLGNVDTVVVRLLKFYNDLVNVYEDILSDLDGRVVGGTSGRFRFDGNKNNPPRGSYSAITNDIDDRVKLYDEFRMTGFFTFALVPVYGTMATPNSLSRIFPIAITKSAGLNDKVTAADYGQVIGTLGVSDVKSAQTMTSTPARSAFSSGAGSSVKIPQNGDSDNLIPKFAANQDVGFYDLDGTPIASGKVVSADSLVPSTVVVNFPITKPEGSLLQSVSDPANTLNHFYVPGRDLNVDFDNGQILNATVGGPPLQNPVSGNEIVDAPVTFNNGDLKSKRVPVLDGLELDDDGRLPAPILKRVSEQALEQLEVASFANFSTAKVFSDLFTLASPLHVSVGDSVEFLTGPNAGLTRQVQTIAYPNFVVSPPFPFADPVGNDIVDLSKTPFLPSVLNDEIGVLSTNVPSAPVPPALIGRISSEISSVVSAILSYGTSAVSSTGAAAPSTLTDPSVSFTLLGVQPGWLVFVPSGPNFGLYKITAVSATVLTVETADPYAAFPAAGSTPYSVIQPLTLLKTSNFDFASSFLRKTQAFLAATQAFQSSITSSSIVSRQLVLLARTADITSFIDQLGTLLGDEKLYSVRYLWIDQRANRQTGTLTKETQATKKRQDDIVKLTEDQQKLLISESL